MINDSYDIFFQRRKRRWVPYRMMASKDTYSGSIRVFVEKDTCTVYWSHRFCFFGYMFNCWNKFLADVGLLNENGAESNRWVSTLPRIWSLCPTPMRINLTWMETKKSPKEMFQEIEKNYAKILITYNQLTIVIIILITYNQFTIVILLSVPSKLTGVTCTFFHRHFALARSLYKLFEVWS